MITASPPGDPPRRQAVRLHPEDAADLEAMAYLFRASRSELIRWGLMTFLGRYAHRRRPPWAPSPAPVSRWTIAPGDAARKHAQYLPPDQGQKVAKLANRWGCTAAAIFAGALAELLIEYATATQALREARDRLADSAGRAPPGKSARKMAR